MRLEAILTSISLVFLTAVSAPSLARTDEANIENASRAAAYVIKVAAVTGLGRAGASKRIRSDQRLQASPLAGSATTNVTGKGAHSVSDAGAIALPGRLALSHQQTAAHPSLGSDYKANKNGPMGLTQSGMATAKLQRMKVVGRDRRRPRLIAAVNLSTQRMTIKIDGVVQSVWKISSGKGGYSTPRGTYTPYRMHTMWRSRKYNNAKMPHSVFYSGGFAVHATYATRQLGRPASHGCIRLSPANARTFFNLVKKYGRHATRIAITGTTPRAYRYARSRRQSKSRLARGQQYAPARPAYRGSEMSRRRITRSQRYRRYNAPRRRPKGLLEIIFQ